MARTASDDRVPASEAVPAGFRVAPWVDRLGGHIARHPRLWLRLANLESRALRERLDAVAIEQPVYIAGLARAGTTILLEMLATHPAVATHRYKDFPPVQIPYWWNWFLDRQPQARTPPAERAHGDGILVTPDSPEAMEEVLWMAFFPRAHDPAASSVLDGSDTAPAFEAFYRDHIRKLLLARRGRRYLSKGNYNLTRLQYLQRLFPDARFVVPIRAPVHQVASLMKQHALFCRAEQADPRTLEHMRRVGHFEFGLDRRIVNVGDDATVRAIHDLWDSGEDARGWARYWASLYGWVADTLAADPKLREAVHVVRFEDLCAAPAETLGRALAHCGLDDRGGLLDDWAGRVTAPTYYRVRFSEAELAAIAAETDATAARFGYERQAEERLDRIA